MGWNVTNDLDEYLAQAGAFLRAEPAENTVALGVIETLRVHGNDAYGDTAALFGWWRSGGGAVGGAFLRTPPHPLLLSDMPEHAAEELAVVLADHQDALPGVIGDRATAQAFAGAWESRMGVVSEVKMRQRLYRLDRLEVPKPLPPGASRIATASDRDHVLAWYEAFGQEILASHQVNATLVNDKISYSGIALWEVDGAPVSLAGRTRVAVDMVRVAPVYTPLEHRRRGYGAAVTAAITESALDAGAREVVLFTDLANPTSNSIYQQLGYRPVSDRLMLSFAA